MEINKTCSVSHTKKLSYFLLVGVSFLLTINQQLVEALGISLSNNDPRSRTVHRRDGIIGQLRRCSRPWRSTSSALSMIRNIDLPEALIFYGTNTVFHNPGNSVRPGLMKLLAESKDIGTACILLSESVGTKVLEERVQQSDLSGQKNHLILRSSLEIEDGLGYSPSPLALLETISSVMIEPRGFGGSSGFGTKQADPERSPLAKHCVVFAEGKRGRDRSLAARVAGMRVMYIEEKMGDCDADDLVDGVISTLDELYGVDDVSTPGQFWLNPPSSRDQNGNGVNPWDVADAISRQRLVDPSTDNGEKDEAVIQNSPEELDENEVARILADIDPL
eukprot:CAMPEP_0116021374 /NCGR_PEP_ID=MMETSP0321-20121206/10349_1 /TAXON_ID=163516 /ORGANISM="Leptocylindrus danicus var. danicus, Strain B650" /LENGTH=333 /DNA_ID=CAMNT_0003492233 /DNA_START=134 /DNA_END=1135 /DNA_ORIENTATION=-